MSVQPKEHQQDRSSATRHATAEADRNARNVANLRRIEQAYDLRQTGKKGRIFPKSEDRKIAAIAVSELVQEARAKGVTIELIKENKRGTKRIDRYMLKTSKAKTEKLSQKVNGYLDVATAVASLTKQSADDLKIRVLSGTSVWAEVDASKILDDPRAGNLTLELQEMARSIIRECNLAKLFDRARRVPGVWQITEEKFAPSSMACLYQPAYLGAFEHWTEAPPFPSVPLARYVHSYAATTVKIESAGHEIRLSGEIAYEDDFAGEGCEAWFEVSREIHLSIGPVTSPGDIGPMLESRASVALGLLYPSPYLNKLWPNLSLKVVNPTSPLDLLNPVGFLPRSVFQIERGGFWHRVAMTEPIELEKMQIFDDGDHPIEWLADPQNASSPRIEHWYISWSALNSRSVNFWLDRPLDKNSICVAPEGPNRARVVLYPTSVLAHGVERALATGGLEAELMAVIRRFAESLDQRENEWNEEIAATHAERLRSWQTKTTNGDVP